MNQWVPYLKQCHYLQWDACLSYFVLCSLRFAHQSKPHIGDWGEGVCGPYYILLCSWVIDRIARSILVKFIGPAISILHTYEYIILGLLPINSLMNGFIHIQVGKLSMEWKAEEKTKVLGTFPPVSRPTPKWTGFVEKDTAGQTNIYAVEVSN